MNNLTPEQKNKILAAADIVENGDLAVLKKLLEFQDFVDENKGTVERLTKQAEEVFANIKQVKDGRDGRDGRDAEITPELINEIASKVKVPVVEKVVEKTVETIIKEQPIVTNEVTNEIVEVAVTDSPDKIVAKINSLDVKPELQIAPEHIRGYTDMERNMKENLARVPKDFDVRIGVSKTELKRLTDRVETLEAGGSSGGGHTIQDEGSDLTQRTNLNFVGAGVTVTDDSGNDATVVTISTSAGAGYQVPSSGTINGTNTEFVFAVAPNAIVVDGVSMRKVAGDTTVNWTGTTTITLTVAPTFDIYGVA